MSEKQAGTRSGGEGAEAVTMARAMIPSVTAFATAGVIARFIGPQSAVDLFMMAAINGLIALGIAAWGYTR